MFQWKKLQDKYTWFVNKKNTTQTDQSVATSSKLFPVSRHSHLLLPTNRLRKYRITVLYAERNECADVEALGDFGIPFCVFSSALRDIKWLRLRPINVDLTMAYDGRATQFRPERFDRNSWYTIERNTMPCEVGATCTELSLVVRNESELARIALEVIILCLTKPVP